MKIVLVSTYKPWKTLENITMELLQNEMFFAAYVVSSLVARQAQRNYYDEDTRS